MTGPSKNQNKVIYFYGDDPPWHDGGSIEIRILLSSSVHPPTWLNSFSHKGTHLYLSTLTDLGTLVVMSTLVVTFSSVPSLILSFGFSPSSRTRPLQIPRFSFCKILPQKTLCLFVLLILNDCNFFLFFTLPLVGASPGLSANLGCIQVIDTRIGHQDKSERPGFYDPGDGTRQWPCLVVIFFRFSKGSRKKVGVCSL